MPPKKSLARGPEKQQNDASIIFDKMASKSDRSQSPTFAKGRKGQVSLLDLIVKVLWDGSQKAFSDLRSDISELAGYAVSESTIRSTIYSHSDLFDQNIEKGRKLWRLSEKARKAKA